MPRSNLVAKAFIWDLFSKTIAAFYLKVGKSIELNDLMKLHEYQRSRSL